MKHFLLLIFFVLAAFPSGVAQSVMPLYEGPIPGEIPSENKEYVDRAVTFLVSKPDLTVYLPVNQAKARSAILICPGGGYGCVCNGYEGEKIALDMNQKGVVAFVLKYRLPSDRTCANKTIAPLQDAQRAMKIIRDNAEKWGVDPEKVGVIGFSAGGHLASTLGTHYSESLVPNQEETNLRPDFMMLVYPVISMSPQLTHGGSRDNLLGLNPTPELMDLYSNEKQVTEDTPPTFLIHATDDRVVPVENSIRFYEALKSKKIAVDMHLFSTGNHGFPLEPAKSNWLMYAFQWMKEQGLIDN